MAHNQKSQAPPLLVLGRRLFVVVCTVAVGAMCGGGGERPPTVTSKKKRNSEQQGTEIGEGDEGEKGQGSRRDDSSDGKPNTDVGRAVEGGHYRPCWSVGVRLSVGYWAPAPTRTLLTGFAPFHELIQKRGPGAIIFVETQIRRYILGEL